MVALVVGDRAQETCTTTGTGTLSLLGAVTQFQSFAAVGVSTGNTISYGTQFTVVDQSGANWETSIGVYTTSGSTLTRTTVLSSSNAGALVNFGAGTKSVFMDYSATMSVSGGGGGTYPTIQPTLNHDFANTKQLDPRITFVRNSTAAYYDGQTSAMAEQNLLLQSNTFSNAAWVATNGTVVSGVTDPAGTTTAFNFTATGVATLYQTLTTTATPYTLSFYIQRVIGTGAVNLTLDGTILTPQTITGSWARYSVTATPTAASHTIGIQLAVITDSVNIFSSQLENRSSMTAANITTTSAITNYIPVLLSAPAGVARFDCDPLTGKSLGLLIEESRTNLVLQSQFASGFTFVRTTQNINTIIAPDGTLTASKIIPTNVNGSHAFYKEVTVVSGTSSTWSGYFKAGEYNTIHLNCQASASIYIVKFNLTSGTSTNVSGTGTASITLVGNGWYRCTATATTASTSGYWQFDICDNSGNTVYTGDGYSGIYIWGAQLEAGSFATSYIPTVASTVTRAADSASMTGTNFSSWYNQAQGSLYAESDDNGANTNGAATLFNTGAAGNNSIAFYGTGTLNTARLLVRLNTVYIINTSSSVTTQPIKQAASFKDGAVSCTANGSLFVTNVNVNIPHNLDTLYIGYFPGTLSYLTGHIRKISYYPVALSSSNLVALTS